MKEKDFLDSITEFSYEELTKNAKWIDRKKPVRQEGTNWGNKLHFEKLFKNNLEEYQWS